MSSRLSMRELVSMLLHGAARLKRSRRLAAQRSWLGRRTATALRQRAPFSGRYGWPHWERVRRPETIDPKFLFESEPLDGLPQTRRATFVHVLVPSDGQTSVHTHPGPELIYMLAGDIEYENALIGALVMGPGDDEGIASGVTVQKRNPFDADAEFLSWFLVDPEEPFASAAQFGSAVDRGENLGSAQQGARVVGVSSNYAGDVDDSALGANSAIDGDPATAWSSDGDGDAAWIEIELKSETRVTSIGLWTRTMGASAQIFTFRVVTDRGQTAGPFELNDASRLFHFDTDLVAKRLRFEGLSSSGGNTGLIEIEVYGEPTP